MAALIAVTLEAVAINVATTPAPPNFQTCGNHCKLDDAAHVPDGASMWGGSVDTSGAWIQASLQGQAGAQGCSAAGSGT